MATWDLEKFGKNIQKCKVGKLFFLHHFKYKRIDYNKKVMQHTTCLQFNPILCNDPDFNLSYRREGSD